MKKRAAEKVSVKVCDSYHALETDLLVQKPAKCICAMRINV